MLGRGAFDASLVARLDSVPIARFGWRRLWVSSARLSSRFCETYGGRFEVPIDGMGWGTSRDISAEEGCRDAFLRLALFLIRRGVVVGDFGFEQDPSDFGFALGEVDPVGVAAGALGTWYLDQLGQGKAGLVRASIPWGLRESRLFNLSEGTLHLYRASSDPFVAVASWVRGDGGIHLSAEADPDFRTAVAKALRALFLRKRRFERIRSGREQLLDRMADQRLWLFGSTPELAVEMQAKLERALLRDPFAGPEIYFAREFEGPWNPRFRLSRVLFKGMRSPWDGPLERWV